MPRPGASSLSYRASIPLSNHTLIRLAEFIRTRRAERRSRWRKLDPARQALLVLAHLRNGGHLRSPGRWLRHRHHHGLALPPRKRGPTAALADDVHAAVKRAAQLAYTILDGTLIPIDRLADERPYYSGSATALV
jgi:hypothetical protein